MLYKAKISGERLQDHWSSGLSVIVFQTPHLGDIGRPCEGLTNDQLQTLQRFDPCGTESKSQYFTDNDTIGFFIAKFVKEPNG